MRKLEALRLHSMKQPVRIGTSRSVFFEGHVPSYVAPPALPEDLCMILAVCMGNSENRGFSMGCWIFDFLHGEPRNYSEPPQRSFSVVATSA